MAGKMNVIIAVDGSQHSDYAVTWYLDQQKQPYHHVVFVMVAPQFRPIYGAGTYVVSPVVMDNYIRETEQHMSNVKAKVEQLMKGQNVTYEFVQETGDAGHRICHVGKEKEAIMFVIGSRGLGTIRRTLLGSVSDYVMHHAHVPVTVTHMPPTE